MKKGNTKERILMAALDLFSVKGYEGTTMEEIAQSVGIKAPTIYKYLSGKEALLQELIDKSEAEYDAGMERNFRGADKICSGSDLKGFAMRLVEFTMDHEMAVKMRRMLMIEQYRNESFAESATRHQITQIRTAFAAIFADLMEKGAMIKGDPDMTALGFTAPVTLMIQMSDRQPEKKQEALATIDKYFDAFIERYCNIQQGRKDI